MVTPIDIKIAVQSKVQWFPPSNLTLKHIPTAGKFRLVNKETDESVLPADWYGDMEYMRLYFNYYVKDKHMYQCNSLTNDELLAMYNKLDENYTVLGQDGKVHSILDFLEESATELNYYMRAVRQKHSNECVDYEIYLEDNGWRTTDTDELVKTIELLPIKMVGEIPPPEPMPAEPHAEHNPIFDELVSYQETVTEDDNLALTVTSTNGSETVVIDPDDLTKIPHTTPIDKRIQLMLDMNSFNDITIGLRVDGKEIILFSRKPKDIVSGKEEPINQYVYAEEEGEPVATDDLAPPPPPQLLVLPPPIPQKDPVQIFLDSWLRVFSVIGRVLRKGV